METARIVPLTALRRMQIWYPYGEDHSIHVAAPLTCAIVTEQAKMMADIRDVQTTKNPFAAIHPTTAKANSHGEIASNFRGSGDISLTEVVSPSQYCADCPCSVSDASTVHANAGAIARIKWRHRIVDFAA